MGKPLFNWLPDDIRSIEDLDSFKNKQSTFLLEEAYYSVDYYLL